MQEIKAAVETRIGNAFRRGAAANNARRIDLGLQRRFERQIDPERHVDGAHGNADPPAGPGDSDDLGEQHGDIMTPGTDNFRNQAADLGKRGFYPRLIRWSSSTIAGSVIQLASRLSAFAVGEAGSAM